MLSLVRHVGEKPLGWVSPRYIEQPWTGKSHVNVPISHYNCFDDPSKIRARDESIGTPKGEVGDDIEGKVVG